jgi:hypothetical protein
LRNAGSRQPEFAPISYIAEDGDRIVIFKGLPEESLTENVPDWYTNEAGFASGLTELTIRKLPPRAP